MHKVTFHLSPPQYNKHNTIIYTQIHNHPKRLFNHMVCCLHLQLHLGKAKSMPVVIYTCKLSFNKSIWNLYSTYFQRLKIIRCKWLPLRASSSHLDMDLLQKFQETLSLCTSFAQHNSSEKHHMTCEHDNFLHGSFHKILLECQS